MATTDWMSRPVPDLDAVFGGGGADAGSASPRRFAPGFAAGGRDDPCGGGGADAGSASLRRFAPGFAAGRFAAGGRNDPCGGGGSGGGGIVSPRDIKQTPTIGYGGSYGHMYGGRDSGYGGGGGAGGGGGYDCVGVGYNGDVPLRDIKPQALSKTVDDRATKRHRPPPSSKTSSTMIDLTEEPEGSGAAASGVGGFGGGLIGEDETRPEVQLAGAQGADCAGRDAPVCKVCWVGERDAIIIHGDSSHHCACLACARSMLARGQGCPMVGCGKKIDFVARYCG